MSEQETTPKVAMPLRNVRVPDRIWEAAMKRAREEGQTLSGVIRQFLYNYAKGDN